MNIPRAEFPQPQWERKNWLNLNGEWEFEFDFGKSAIERKRFENKLEKNIIVPFCMESELSGIGYKDFVTAVCYKKTVSITAKQLENKVFLHFGAVDYHTEVFINGKNVGSHDGGYTPFMFDITNMLHTGENTIFVWVVDDIRNRKQPAGKQSNKYESYGCSYTRTTGIWQTVWLEFVPEKYIKKAKYYTDIENCTLTITGETNGTGEVCAEVSYDDKTVGSAKVYSDGCFSMTVKLSEKHLWEAGKGRLYNILFKMGDDEVISYFGLRSIRFENKKFLLNGKSVFQRLVLDQGFYKDGIYTAPNEEALINDINISLDAGFNGARLHEKLFEPRFLYYCDKMGYLVWDEYANWGLNHRADCAPSVFINEWVEAVERDFNHPSVVGWCPFNETWGYISKNETNKMLQIIYKITKQLDGTRPCIDTSGVFHVITDVYDIHDYEQDGKEFGKHYEHFAKTGILENEEKVNAFFSENQSYTAGLPMFVSEYGGIMWDVSGEGWGYGNAPKSEDEFKQRYKDLTEVLLKIQICLAFAILSYMMLSRNETDCIHMREILNLILNFSMM